MNERIKKNLLARGWAATERGPVRRKGPSTVSFKEAVFNALVEELEMDFTRATKETGS